MRRSRLRTRSGILLAVALSTVFSLLPARAATGVDRLMQNSRFCDTARQFRPGPAVTDGPASQIPVHTSVFERAYARACRIGSGLMTFLGTGERAGIKAILARRPDRAFGTADVPLSPTELIQADVDMQGRNVAVAQIPLFVTVGAVAYNLTSCSVSRLNLRSPVLSLIYSGRITTWGDPLLVQDNKQLAKCAGIPIRITKRADYAGSTLTFKDYLSKRNSQWAYYKQPAQNQLWPTITNACPALDEDGMAECIATTPNSIGYLSYHAARVAGLRTAFLDNIVSQSNVDPANPNKAFVGPSPQGCTKAAASAFIPPPIRRRDVPVPGVATYTTPSFSPTQGDWSTVSLTDAPEGYPLCSFGYAFIFQNIQSAYFPYYYSPNAARTAVDYLWVAVSSAGQRALPRFDYGSLPENVADVSRAGLESIRYQF